MSRSRPHRFLLPTVLAVLLVFVIPLALYDLLARDGLNIARGMYVAVAASLVISAVLYWVETLLVLTGDRPGGAATVATYGTAAAIVLPGGIEDVRATVSALHRIHYPETVTILLCNPVSDSSVSAELEALVEHDPSAALLPIRTGEFAGQEIERALLDSDARVIGIYAAGELPEPDAFTQAWRMLSTGEGCVLGRVLPRNPLDSFASRLAVVEATAHDNPSAGDASGNGASYWWRNALIATLHAEPHGRWVELARNDCRVNPALLTRVPAPTSYGALWRSRVDAARLWYREPHPSAAQLLRQALPAWLKVRFLVALIWRDIASWLTLQVFALSVFWLWWYRHDTVTTRILPIVVLLVLYMLYAAPARAAFAYASTPPGARRGLGSAFLAYFASSLVFDTAVRSLAVCTAQVAQLSGVSDRPSAPASAPSGVAASAGAPVEAESLEMPAALPEPVTEPAPAAVAEQPSAAAEQEPSGEEARAVAPSVSTFERVHALMRSDAAVRIVLPPEDGPADAEEPGLPVESERVEAGGATVDEALATVEPVEHAEAAGHEQPADVSSEQAEMVTSEPASEAAEPAVQAVPQVEVVPTTEEILGVAPVDAPLPREQEPADEEQPLSEGEPVAAEAPSPAEEAPVPTPLAAPDHTAAAPQVPQDERPAAAVRETPAFEVGRRLLLHDDTQQQRQPAVPPPVPREEVSPAIPRAATQQPPLQPGEPAATRSTFRREGAPEMDNEDVRPVRPLRMSGESDAGARAASRGRAADMAAQLNDLVQDMVQQLDEREQERGELLERIRILEEETRANEAYRRSLREVARASSSPRDLQVLQEMVSQLVQNPDIRTISQVVDHAATLTRVLSDYAWLLDVARDS